MLFIFARAPADIGKIQFPLWPITMGSTFSYENEESCNKLFSPMVWNFWLIAFSPEERRALRPEGDFVSLRSELKLDVSLLE